MANKDTGKSYLERILAKLPAEKQGALKEALLSDDVAELIGEGVLMKDEATRLVQEATEEKDKSKRHYDQVNEWWESKQASLAQLTVENADLKKKVKTGGAGDDDPPADPKPKPFELPADVARKSDLQALENQGAAYFDTMMTIAQRHQAEFGEVLDIAALRQHVVKTGMPVDRGGYEGFVAEKRQAKERKATEAREAQIRKEEREKVIAEMSAPPLPTDGGTSPSFAHGTLRGLGKTGEKEFGVAAAVAGFNRRRAEGRSS